MKVVYLTWGETPRSYGVFSSQVIGQFIHNSLLLPKSEFEFVSAVPFIHSGIIREKLGYFDELKRVKNKFIESNVKFKWLPIFTSQNFINSTKSTFRYLHGYSHKLLASHFSKKVPDIVHCRSYHATYAALKVKEKYQLTYKVIFDARGYWPFEVALKKNQELDSLDLAYLKRIEKYCLNNADQVIGVSDTMSNYFRSLTDTPVESIYLSADTSVLGEIERTSTLKEKKQITYCYLGALSDDTWHKPHELYKLYSRLREFTPHCRLMIITTSPLEGIESLFSEFDDNEILYRSSASLKQLRNLLSECDIGLMSYFTPVSDLQKVLADSVMAVKTAEYLAAGMPMIVNKYCGGARTFLERNSIGFSYSPEEPSQISKKEVEKILSTSVQYVQSAAYEFFDINRNAVRYSKIYTSLVEEQYKFKSIQ